MNDQFEYKGYYLKEKITLEIKDWYDREIETPIIVTGIIEEFRIGTEGCLLWIDYNDNNAHVTFKDMTTAYLNSGWENIEFINRYIKK